MNSTVRSCVPNGEAIQRLRVAKGWSVEEMADKSNLSAGTVQNLERSQRVFLCTLRRCADALGVSCDQLLASPTLAPIPQLPPRIEITIKVRVDYSLFDQCEQLVARLEKLAQLVGTVDPIEVTSIDNGTVRITINISIPDALALLNYVDDITWKQMKVIQDEYDHFVLMDVLEFIDDLEQRLRPRAANQSKKISG